MAGWRVFNFPNNISIKLGVSTTLLQPLGRQHFCTSLMLVTDIQILHDCLRKSEPAAGIRGRGFRSRTHDDGCALLYAVSSTCSGQPRASLIVNAAILHTGDIDR